MPHLRDSNDWFEKKITLVRKKFTTEKIVAAVRQKYISKKIAPDLDYWLVEHDGYSTNLVTEYTYYIEYTDGHAKLLIMLILHIYFVPSHTAP